MPTPSDAPTPSIKDLLDEPVPSRRPADPNDPIITEADTYDDFLDKYKVSRSDERFVLDDGTNRPAVKTGTQWGYDIWLTPSELAWDIRKSDVGQRPVMHYEHQCRSCGTAMKLTHEYGEAWTFRCDSCKTVHVRGKAQVGGTRGAGENETL